jgi:hypothetical protein
MGESTKIGMSSSLQEVEDRLGAAHGEAGDDHLPSPARRPIHDLEEAALRVLRRLVVPVPVGGLREDHLGGARGLGVPQERHPAPPEVPGEDEARRPRRLLHREVDDRGAEDVARVGEAGGRAGDGLELLPVGMGTEAGDGPDRVLRGVEGTDRVLPALAVPVQELGVLLLDGAGVAEHEVRQLRRRCGQVDVPLPPRLHQRGEGPAVVDVRVGEDHGVGVLRRPGEVAVALVGLLPPALEEAALQEHRAPLRLEEVHGARHRSHPA